MSGRPFEPQPIVWRLQGMLPIMEYWPPPVSVSNLGGGSLAVQCPALWEVGFPGGWSQGRIVLRMSARRSELLRTSWGWFVDLLIVVKLCVFEAIGLFVCLFAREYSLIPCQCSGPLAKSAWVMGSKSCAQS